MHPINRMIDEACGFDREKHRAAVDLRKKQDALMEALFAALDKWYASPSRRTTETLRQSWEAVVQEDERVAKEKP